MGAGLVVSSELLSLISDGASFSSLGYERMTTVEWPASAFMPRPPRAPGCNGTSLPFVVAAVVSMLACAWYEDSSSSGTSS